MKYRYIPKPWIFSSITDGITVKVAPTFMPERSNSARNEYVWTYNVVIENKSEKRVKLMRRHWEITDGKGYTEEVVAPGVVGEQPVLEPGQVFAYASHTVLKTPSGFMKGDYDMVDDKGSSLRVNVPAFSLDEPHSRPILN